MGERETAKGEVPAAKDDAKEKDKGDKPDPPWLKIAMGVLTAIVAPIVVWKLTVGAAKNDPPPPAAPDAGMAASEKPVPLLWVPAVCGDANDARVAVATCLRGGPPLERLAEARTGAARTRCPCARPIAVQPLPLLPSLPVRLLSIAKSFRPISTSPDGIARAKDAGARNVRKIIVRRWHRACTQGVRRVRRTRTGFARGTTRREALMISMAEGSALQAYRGNLANLATLDRETERELARRWAKGDKKAGEKIVEACLPFVVAVALEYRRWGVPIEDIIQQGNLGLLRAAQKFDAEKDCRLATYAVYWIRAEIREYVVRAYRVVRLGTTKGERRALRAYRTTRESDPEKLAKVSGMDPAKIEMLLPLLAAREASLEGASGDASPMSDRLASHAPSPEEEAGANEMRARARGAVASALEGLTEREQMIVRARMMQDEPVTLQELGDRLGVSKERVRQLEERARGKLRARLDEYRELALAG